MKNSKKGKRTKKFVGLLLVLMLVLAIASTGTSAATNTITIKNAIPDETYTAYKILDLDLEGNGGKQYIYKLEAPVATNPWRDFFRPGQPGAEFLNVDLDTGVAVLKDGVSLSNDSDAAQQFAEAALEYAKTHEGITKGTGTKPEDSVDLVITGIDCGYYVIKGNNAGLVMLDSTTPNVTIEEKDRCGTGDIFAQDDQGNWVKSISANIGEQIELKAYTTFRPGNYYYYPEIYSYGNFSDYVPHPMSFALTTDVTPDISTGEIPGYLKDSTTVYPWRSGDGDGTTTATISGLSKKLSEAKDTLTMPFSIVLDERANIGGDSNSILYIPYHRDYTADEEGNFIRIMQHRPQRYVHVYTYEFDIANTDGNNNLLAGGGYKLYSSETGDDEIKLVRIGNGVYRPATPVEISAEDESGKKTFTPATIQLKSDGTAKIQGIGHNVWIQQTYAPTGYDLKEGRTEVIINNANNNFASGAISNGKYVTAAEGQGGGVQFINNKGPKLPSTGSIGTKLFYLFGAVLVIGAVIFLVAKKQAAVQE